MNFRLLLGSLALLGLLAGCTHSGGDSAHTIYIQLSAEPVSLDPAYAEDGISMKVIHNLMDGLVGYDGSGKLENRLAEKMSVSPDGRRYEFTMRPGARWSDGKPVAAHDFVVALRRSLSHEAASKTAPLLFSIRGAEKYFRGKASASELGVSETPDGKLVIELEKPTPYFLGALTLMVAMPAREDFLAAHGGKWTEAAPTTGPYRITRHRLEQEIVFEPNPGYYGFDEPIANYPKVVMRIVPDESTALSLFEKGALDILTRVPEFDIARLREKKLVHADPFVATYFIAFNQRKAPFKEPEFRRAVAGAINREEIARMLGSGETPARSWIPRGIEGYEAYSGPVAAFRDAVATAKGKGVAQEIQAGFDSGARNANIMQKIQADLQSVGMRLSLTPMDWKSYVKQLGVDAPAIYRFGCLAPFLDPIFHLRFFTSHDPNNYTGWSNPEYDRLVDEIATMPEGAARRAKIARAQEILTERDAVVVPIYHYVQVHAVSPRVERFQVNPFGVIRFRDLRLRSAAERH